MLIKSGTVKYNFKHFLFSYPSYENDQKYDYFTLLHVYGVHYYQIWEHYFQSSMLPVLEHPSDWIYNI